MNSWNCHTRLWEFPELTSTLTLTRPWKKALSVLTCFGPPGTCLWTCAHTSSRSKARLVCVVVQTWTWAYWTGAWTHVLYHMLTLGLCVHQCVYKFTSSTRGSYAPMQLFIYLCYLFHMKIVRSTQYRTKNTGLLILQYCIGIASIGYTFSVLPEYCNTFWKWVLVSVLPILLLNIGIWFIPISIASTFQ